MPIYICNTNTNNNTNNNITNGKLPNILFVHIPKTAGSYIEKLLKRIYRQTEQPLWELCPILKRYRQHYTLQELNNLMLINNKDNTYIPHNINKIITSNNTVRFTVVRNPFDRLYSAYQQINNPASGPDIKDIFGNKGFSHFVKNKLASLVASNDFTYSKTHIQPQYQFIENNSFDNCHIDYISKFENLEQDFLSFLQENNVNLESSEYKFNGHPKNCIKYLKFYDREMIQIVKRVYEKDFILYYPDIGNLGGNIISPIKDKRFVSKDNSDSKKNNCTFVTALFDIERDKYENQPLALKKIQDYYKWFKTTLKLNTPMVIFTQNKCVAFIKEHRPIEYPTRIIIQKKEDMPYYKYKSRMVDIFNMPDYMKRIKDRQRIECILPEYCIIQYSKFEWLKLAAQFNTFQTDNFFWIDAGCSRFFGSVNISNMYPGPKTQELLNDGKFIIQGRNDLHTYPTNDNFIWDSVNLLVGTMFGGNSNVVLQISDEINKIWENDMLNKNCVNNEQLALAILWKKQPSLFNVFINNFNTHLPLFQVLSN